MSDRERTEFLKTMLEARYLITEIEDRRQGGDKGTIEMLNYWLEQWLLAKDHCPVCGTESICP